MRYQKKDLFSIPAFPENERPSFSIDRFPPGRVDYNGEKLFLLGASNKDDLLKEVPPGTSQYIYSNLDGELFEVAIVQEYGGIASITGIRTRRKA